MSQFKTALARIWDRGGAVAGAGFLVDDRHLLTCAHVVALALGGAQDAMEPPKGSVQVDFPLLDASPAERSAAVVRWCPVRPDGTGDVAGLRLEGEPPPGAAPVMLVSADNPWGQAFRTFGFPSGRPGGNWAHGVLTDAQATRWLQIEHDRATGTRVQPGYSGAPVWADELHGMVGMVVAADRAAADRVAYVIPTAVLLEAWPDVLTQRAIPPCPYQGLAAFREEHAENFFGRQDVVDRLVTAVDRQPLLAVVGPSGSGKSSVVLAGLLPALRRTGEWTILTCRPRKNPFEELARVLLAELDPEMSRLDRLQRTPELAELLERGRLEQVIEDLLGDREQHRLLLVIDQFEELYTHWAAPPLPARFVDSLLAAVKALSGDHRRALTIVLTMRADILGLALAHRGFAEALRGAINPIGPMSRAQLRAVIQEPAQGRGVHFEAGLIKRILDDVGDSPGRLPLLEFALTLLWDRQERRILTHAAYDTLGGVEGALARYADDLYEQLPTAEQERAQRIFSQLVTPGEGTEDSRRLATRDDLEPDDWELVQRLADGRLIVTDSSPAGEQTVELAHEALIRSWGRLRQWIAKDRDFRTWQERVRSAIRLWREKDQDDDILLRGSLLVEAETWLRDPSRDVGREVRDFVQRSRERQDREDAGFRRLYQQALSRQLIAQAELARTHRPNLLQLSVLLSIESLRRSPSFEADYALRRSLILLPVEGVLLPHDGPVHVVACSPDGTLVVTGSDEGTARVWDTRSGAERARLSHGPGGLVRAVAFSPDGLLVATGGEDGTARIWDPRGGAELNRLPHGGWVGALGFSPDGSLLVTGCDDGTAGVWPLNQPDQITRLTHEGWVRFVAFALDGALLVTGGRDGAVRLWAAPGWDKVGSLDHDGPLRAVALEEDGTRSLRVVTASDDGQVGFWRITSEASTDRAEGWRIIKVGQLRYDSSVVALGFSPDGRRLAIGSEDGHARVLAVPTDGIPGELHRLRHDGAVRAAAFTPDGTRLATASDDGTARIWDTTSGAEQIRATHDGAVRAVAFTPDGTRLATASDDGTARIWDTTSGTVMYDLRCSEWVAAAALDRLGRRVTAVGEDGAARIWSFSPDPALPVELKHEGWIQDVAFSLDGQQVATGGQDLTARVWDADTGEERCRLPHDAPVGVVAFSQAGDRLATGSEDGAVSVWHLSPQDLIRQACQRVTRDLTPAQWRRYLGDEKYRKTCSDVVDTDPGTSAHGEELRGTERGEGDDIRTHGSGPAPDNVGQAERD